MQSSFFRHGLAGIFGGAILTAALLLTAVQVTYGQTAGATCASPATLCGSYCYNLSYDSANCGTCGNTCASGSYCQNSACVASTHTPSPSPSPSPTYTSSPSPTYTSPSPSPSATATTDAKTSCTNQGYKWCLNSDGVSGWCTYSTTISCPAYTQADCTAQAGKWCYPAGGASGSPWCVTGPNASCPASTQSECTAQGGKWCVPSSGASGSPWCSTGPYASCPTYDSTATATPSPSPTTAACASPMTLCGSSCSNLSYDSANCGACGKSCASGTTCQNGACVAGSPSPSPSPSPYCGAVGQACCPTGKACVDVLVCTRQSNGSDICAHSSSPTPSPTSSPTPSPTQSADQTKCTSQGYKWCSNSDGVSGWCTNSATYSCPASTEAECKTQAGKWCKNQGGVGGWCSTGQYASCPVYNETDCKAENGKWCKNSDGVGGYCSTGQYASCPVNNEVDCKAQSGKWCKGASGVGGWCSTGPYASCPVNNEADCKAENGKWCKNSDGVSGYCSTGQYATCPVYNDTDCKAQGGKWCKSTATYGGAATGSAGYCASPPNPICPVNNEADCAAQDGEWCKNAASVPAGGSTGWCTSKGGCPINDETTCKAKGRQWCQMQYGSGGWCASSGQTCGGLVVVPTHSPSPHPTDKPGIKCLDGSTAAAGAACPTYVCADGSKVSSPGQCPKQPTQDAYGICLSRGDTWCSSDAANVKNGYCVANGSPCSTTPVPTYSPTPYPNQPPSVFELDKRQLRDIESQKKQMLRELRDMERFYKKVKNNKEPMAKISAMKAKIEAFKPKDSSAWDDLRDLQDAMQDLRSDFQDAIEEQNERGGGFDEERLLKDMKRGVRSFEQYLRQLETRVKSVERSGIKVVQTFKDTIAKAKAIAGRIKTAETYDDIRDLQEEMAEVGHELADYMHKLQQLSQLPQALRIVNQQVAEADRLTKAAAAAVKRLRLEATDQVNEMVRLTAEMREAADKIKTGGVEIDDIFGYIEENIGNKLDDIRQISDQIKGAANLRAYIGKINADVRRFTQQIARLEKAGESMADAYTLLEDLKTNLAGLRPLANVRLTAEVGDQVLNYLQTIADITEQLQEAVHAVPADVLEQQLRRLFEGGGQKIKETNFFDALPPTVTATPASPPPAPAPEAG